MKVHIVLLLLQSTLAVGSVTLPAGETITSPVKDRQQLTPGDCECVTQLVLDFISAHDWTNMVIVPSSEGSLLPKACLVGWGSSTSRGLVREAWRRRLRVTVREEGVWRNTLAPPEVAGHQNFLVVDGNATHSLLQEASSRSLFARSSWAVLAPSSSDLAQLSNLMQDLDAFIPSEVFVLQYSQCRAQVSSLYRVGPRVRDVQLEVGGRWTPSEGFQGGSLDSEKLERRWDFKGYPMRGVGVNVFEFFSKYMADGSASGFVGDIVTALKRIHNFTLTISILPGYSYGTLISTDGSNKWNGMVGELQFRRADLTLSEVSVTPERARVVTFTQPIRVISRKLFVGIVEDNKAKILTYYRCMAPNMYICTFFTMLTLAVIMYFADKWTYNLLPCKYEKRPISLGTAFWDTVLALLQTDSQDFPSALVPRTVFYIVLIVAMLVNVAYTATLTSVLSVQSPVTLPFSNLYELSKLSGWDAGCNRNDLFQVASSQTCAVEPRSADCQTMYDVWNNNVLRSPNNLVGNYSMGIQRALEGQYVFIGVGVATRHYVGLLPKEVGCKIRELPGSYIQGGISIGLQYRSPFQPSFDRSLLNIREMGLMEKLVKIWLNVKTTCDREDLISADMIDVSSIFVLLIAGIALSLIVLAGEITHKKLGLRNRSDTREKNALDEK